MATICEWNDETARVKLARVDDLGACDLLSRLLVADPSKRLGLSDALEHVFFNPRNTKVLRMLDVKFSIPFVHALPPHIDRCVVEDCVGVAADLHKNGLPESKSIDGKYVGNHYGFTIVVGDREERVAAEADVELVGSRAVMHESASPRSTHLDESARGASTSTEYGLLGSGTPCREMDM